MSRHPLYIVLALAAFLLLTTLVMSRCVVPALKAPVPTSQPGLAITVVVPTLVPAPTLELLEAGSPTTKTPRPIPEPILIPRSTATVPAILTATPTVEPTKTSVPVPMRQRG